jgi:hypothetical protein
MSNKLKFLNNFQYWLINNMVNIKNKFSKLLQPLQLFIYLYYIF